MPSPAEFKRFAKTYIQECIDTHPILQHAFVAVRGFHRSVQARKVQVLIKLLDTNSGKQEIRTVLGLYIKDNGETSVEYDVLSEIETLVVSGCKAIASNKSSEH